MLVCCMRQTTAEEHARAEREQNWENGWKECPYQNDNCNRKFNGMCDRNRPKTCPSCIDCDPCNVNFSCSECTSKSGCVWCGADALCVSESNVPSTLMMINKPDVDIICNDETDFVSTCDASSNIYNDPAYDSQAWVYKLINVENVWKAGITGKGVNIRINDSGVDNEHPDFASKFDINSSCDRYKPQSSAHGTIVAAIAAASADNDSCSVGIAPGATLSSCEIFSGWDWHPVGIYDETKNVDVSNNSWGRDICKERNDDFSCKYTSISEEDQGLFMKGVTKGRNGKGIIYVFAAGNQHDESINNDGILNSRFTITVGAVEKRGKFYSHTTKGAALFMTAPGGDKKFVHNHFVAHPGGECKSRGPGTSYAAPVVSGVVALMLEVNSNLGWRDVQGILASTSTKNDPDDKSWTINAAGLHHSRKYGFGLVNAEKAVESAKKWQNYPLETEMVLKSGSINLTITDDKLKDVNSTLSVTNKGPTSILIAESVVVYVNLIHPSRGDLYIVLTSPGGTRSILHPGKRPEKSKSEYWKLMTVRNWGEETIGDWTITIIDIEKGNFNGEVLEEYNGKLISWELVLYGHNIPT